eukprot:gene15130-16686_t
MWLHLGQYWIRCLKSDYQAETHFGDGSKKKNGCESKKEGYECDKTFHQLLYDNLESCKMRLESVEEKCERSEQLEHARKNISKKEENCNVENINVKVNNKQLIEGKSIKNELYIPFSFIKKHFEIYGKFKDDTAKKKVFDWKHSLINVTKIGAYSSNGVYVVGNQQGNVGQRSKVLYIDGVYEVPVSNQWDKNGYFYPIQIAQFGLSHYSKYLLDKKSGKVAEREKIKNERWNISPGCLLKKKFDKQKGRHVLHFDTKGDRKGTGIFIKFEQPKKKKNFISFDIKFKNPGTAGNAKKTSKKSLQKSIALDSILKLRIVGSAWLDTTVLSSAAHDVMFMKAADWLLKFQDFNGGWSVNVTRKITKSVVINPGWYSAMGQGQAISLLTRVYDFTKKQVYLDAALRAVKLFDIDVKDGGIVSRVLGVYRIYEEYPSTPSFHVLNGFIFSLIGLYDLSQTKVLDANSERLYKQGIDTLLRIMPLYDNGHGTFYDLRHIALPGSQPNRARWDYHAVHINQLQLLMQIHPHQTFDSLLKRWVGYAAGVPAPHN